MTGPGWAAVWTAVAGVVVAVAGAAATMIVNRRNERLKARLDFVNMQLRYFYGPLLAYAEASQRAWDAFVQRYKPGAVSTFWDPPDPPSEEAVRSWYRWMVTVFMPLNLRQMDIIFERPDLLIDAGIPQCLTDLCGHILALEAVLESWQDDPHFRPETPDYPASLLDYLISSFGALKREQAKLLNAIAGTGEHPLTDNTAEISLLSEQWQNPGQIVPTSRQHETPDQQQ
jgi:hypothetical protein